METIAVYWEPIIRTYGFSVQEGLVLCQMNLTPKALGRWGHMFASLPDEPASAFRLVWVQSEDMDRMTFFMLCDQNHWSRLRPLWRCPEGRDTGPADFSDASVDLLYFQGPHFGDRYGIMDFTYNVLNKEKVPLLAVTCSMATIYLVLPAGEGIRAKKRMSAAFEIPMCVQTESGADHLTRRDVEP